MCICATAWLFTFALQNSQAVSNVNVIVISSVNKSSTAFKIQEVRNLTFEKQIKVSNSKDT